MIGGFKESSDVKGDTFYITMCENIHYVEQYIIWPYFLMACSDCQVAQPIGIAFARHVGQSG